VKKLVLMEKHDLQVNSKTISRRRIVGEIVSTTTPNNPCFYKQFYEWKKNWILEKSLCRRV